MKPMGMDTSVQDLRNIFHDLEDKDFVTLYNLGQIQNLSTDELLFREGEKGHSISVVLKGRLRLIKRVGESLHEVAVLHPGDAVCESTTLSTGERMTSAVAAQPSTVLTFSESMLRALDPGLHLHLTRRLTDTQVRRLMKAEEKEATLAARCDYLTEYVRRSVVERTQDYSQSEMIVNMLKKVPQLPMYASRLAQMLLDENVSAKEVAAIAKNDPSLVSAVLKRVNSAYYNWQKKISDFQHAVILLGFNQVYQLVISDGLRRTMPNTPPFRKLHNHSVVISHIAHEITHLIDRRQASMMSTIALLHDIGKSVILLLKRQNPKLTVLIDILDPAKIGALLLEEWNIPEAVCRAVEFQEYAQFTPPEDIPEDVRRTVAVLHLSHRCADILESNGASPQAPPFSDDFLKTLRLRYKTVTSLTEDYVRPSLEKKIAALPEHVRQFLRKRTKERSKKS